MKRRDMAWLLLAPMAASQAQTQTTTPAEGLKAAQEAVKKESAELAKFVIPMATEPAFAFKA